MVFGVKGAPVHLLTWHGYSKFRC